MDENVGTGLAILAGLIGLTGVGYVGYKSYKTWKSKETPQIPEKSKGEVIEKWEPDAVKQWNDAKIYQDKLKQDEISEIKKTQETAAKGIIEDFLRMKSKLDLKANEIIKKTELMYANKNSTDQSQIIDRANIELEKINKEIKLLEERAKESMKDVNKQLMNISKEELDLPDSVSKAIITTPYEILKDKIKSERNQKEEEKIRKELEKKLPKEMRRELPSERLMGNEILVEGLGVSTDFIDMEGISISEDGKVTIPKNFMYLSEIE